MNSETWRRPATLMAVLLTGLVIVALIFFAFAGGLPATSPLPSVSPTAAAQVSPSAETSLIPGATIGPVTTASPQPTTSAEPTASPEPPPSPPLTPAPSPSAPIPSQSAGPPSAWIELDDFPTYGRATNVSSITAGGPGYVAVGSSGRRTPQGRVWTSQDGQNWTAQADQVFAGYALEIVVRAGQTLYAFGDSRVWSSPNGTTWSLLPAVPELSGARVSDVAVSGDMMVAVGLQVNDSDSGFSPAVWRSSDGTAWQRVGFPATESELSTVAAAGGLLVASQGYPQFSEPLLWYSTDLGDSWRPAQTDLDVGEDSNLGIVDIAATDGRFVAVGYEQLDEYQPIALVSTDGATWQSANLARSPARQIFEQVSARPGGFIAVATGHESGEEGLSWTSADGLDWAAGPAIYSRTRVFEPGDTPGDDVVNHRALAVGASGVVVAASWDFAESEDEGLHVWYAPLGTFD